MQCSFKSTRGTIFQWKVYERGTFFEKKWYIKGQVVGPRGGAFPYKNVLSASPPGGLWEAKQKHLELKQGSSLGLVSSQP